LMGAVVVGDANYWLLASSAAKTLVVLRITVRRRGSGSMVLKMTSRNSPRRCSSPAGSHGRRAHHAVDLAQNLNVYKTAHPSRNMVVTVGFQRPEQAIEPVRVTKYLGDGVLAALQ